MTGAFSLYMPAGSLLFIPGIKNKQAQEQNLPEPACFLGKSHRIDIATTEREWRKRARKIECDRLKKRKNGVTCRGKVQG